MGTPLGSHTPAAIIWREWHSLFASSVIGSVAVGMCVVMFSGPLAALRTVLQQKSTKSLPFPMMIATIANCSLWTFYGFELIHDPFIWFPNFLGLLSGLAQ